MSIKNYNRLDTVTCKVLYTNHKGAVLKINGMEDDPFVIMHDVDISAGSVVLGSIAKISPDYRYVKVRLDSVLDYAA